VEVNYYTDPLCSWSWAFEPVWRRFYFEYGDRLDLRYRMVGMIPDWMHYQDPINDVSRPVQMIPLWIQVRHISGMPLDERLWIEDPPESSYPACVAVKAAELQSREAAQSYLRRLREAAMCERRNIARRDVLIDVACGFTEERPGLIDVERFEGDLEGSEAREAFVEDIKQARYFGIGRFPALTLRRPGGMGVVLIGYRPYEALVDGLRRLVPDAQPSRRAEDESAYAAFWGGATARELAVALGGADRQERGEP
jgi:predicted DsbA family dithiol-disulfide isomerase